MASDGPSGGHSPFAEALLDEQHGFSAEGVTLQDAIANVPRAVEKKGQQKPVEYAITTVASRGISASGPRQEGPMQAPQGEQQTGAVLDTSERGRWMRREWELQDESECLAENGVCTMKALEIMTEQDRKQFRCVCIKFQGLRLKTSVSSMSDLAGCTPVSNLN